MLKKNSRDYEKLPFVQFQKIILDFQLKEHEKFLEKFIVLFKTVDSDNNGVINEEEFRDLIAQMDVIHNDEEVNYLLTVIDPYNNQQMTFSELVHLFSSHMVPVDVKDPENSIPLLEKFVSMGADAALKEESS